MLLFRFIRNKARNVLPNQHLRQYHFPDSLLDNDGADAIIGTFANGPTVSAPYNGKLYEFAISYTAGSGNDIALLTQDVSLLGDYNGDSAVDAADYIVWRKTFGQAVTPFDGADGDGDGDVDNGDYAVWTAHFDQTAGSGSLLNASDQSSTIPEPTSIVLLILSAVLCVARRPQCGQNHS